jgi:hypothetical protein
MLPRSAHDRRRPTRCREGADGACSRGVAHRRVAARPPTSERAILLGTTGCRTPRLATGRPNSRSEGCSSAARRGRTPARGGRRTGARSRHRQAAPDPPPRPVKSRQSNQADARAESAQDGRVSNDVDALPGMCCPHAEAPLSLLFPVPRDPLSPGRRDCRACAQGRMHAIRDAITREDGTTP